MKNKYQLRRERIDREERIVKAFSLMALVAWSIFYIIYI